MQHRKLLPLAIFLGVATFSQPAFAGLSIGAEAGALYTTGRPDTSLTKRVGFGFAGRLGYDLELTILHLIPEVKVSYERLPLETQTNILRPAIGLRAVIDIAVIGIVGFAHVGYTAPLGDHGQIDASGFMYEFGGGIDFTGLPVVDIGIWGSWNQVRSGDLFDWVGFGVSLTISI